MTAVASLSYLGDSGTKYFVTSVFFLVKALALPNEECHKVSLDAPHLFHALLSFVVCG